MPQRLVPCAPSGAGTARRELALGLIDAGVAPSVVADSCLVMTELVANAVHYGAALGGDQDGNVCISWDLRDGAVVLEVIDGGGGEPAPREAADGDTSGRGLAIVDAVSADWGVHHPRPAQTAVWARLLLV